ncbi:MAG: ATP-binding protein [Candidatus Altiarchaeota archaeon]|nr:ATP-binding protein [Candidatus Altiarchaeota archaeon]
MTIIDSLKAQNEWWKTGKVPTALLKKTKREEYKTAEKLLKEERITAITGPRRTGKTTLQYQLIHHLLQETEPNKILYISMDDPSLRPHTQNLLQEILETYYREILLEEKRNTQVHVFIDEIHFHTNWEQWLKKYYDQRYPIKFTITSSSSAHLSQKSKESLVGRIIEILLLPLSFRSYLALTGKNQLTEHYNKLSLETIDADKRFQLLKHEEEARIMFSKYLLYGGLPESIKTGEIHLWQEKLISDVLRKVIYRDITGLYDVRTPTKLEDLFVHLTYNTSKTFSYTSLSQNLGISTEAIINYTRYLQESYLIGELRLHTKSIEKSLRANRKYFIMDCGLQNAITKTTDLTEANTGPLIESTIEKHLYAYAKKENHNLHYWREKEEVDIILDTKKKTLPIEVKYKNKIKKEDMRGLLKFMDKYKTDKGYMITKDLLQKQKINGKEIQLIPAWLFLLAIPAA